MTLTKAITATLTALLPVATEAQIQQSFPHVPSLTPEASAIAQYQDVPVSYYSGTPEISIPLYEIDVDGLRLPLDMKYHASGIKVAQEATWVGLGWTLDVGGRISRTVKDADDFLNGEYDPEHPYYEKGFYYAPDIQFVTNTLAGSYPNTYKIVANPYVQTDSLWGSHWFEQCYDSEPDIFYYNLPTAAGKFMFDKSRGAVLFDKRHNIRVEPYRDRFGDMCILVRDSEGNKYYFRDKETTKCYRQRRALNKNGTYGTKLDDDESTYTEWVFKGFDWEGAIMEPAPVTPYELTSCWCLSEIVTRNNRHVYFKYKDELQKMPTQESCEVISTFDLAGNISYDVDEKYHETKLIHNALRLDSIIFDYGYITFNCSERYDIKGSCKRLDSFSVFNYNGDLIKSVDFTYDYFNPQYIGDEYENVFSRLKLLSIHDSSMENPYRLTYYENHPLPAKNSKNTDYWGYSNGREYGGKYCIGVYYNNEEFDGYKKDADFDYAISGTLHRITYPTGGYHDFTFESNEFPTYFAYRTNDDLSNPSVTDPYLHAQVFLNTYNPSTIGDAAYIGYPTDTTYTFTLQGRSRVTIRCTLESVSGARDPSFNYSNPFGMLYMVSPQDSTYSPLYSEFPLLYEGAGAAGSEVVLAERQIVLEAGTYMLHTGSVPDEVHSEWRINIDGLYPVTPNPDYPAKEYGGGIRILGIKSPATQRGFSYSGGKLLTDPVLYYTAERNYSGVMKPCLIQTFESVSPLSTFCNGYMVGYDCVTEMFEGDDDNPSYTKYYYKNDPELNLVYNQLPEGPVEIVFTNGLLEKKEVYGDDQLIKSNEYEYTSTYSNLIQSIYDRNGHCHPDDHVYYTYQIEWPKIHKETEILNDKYGNTMTDIKYYTYNGRDLIHSIKTHIGNESYTECTLYPFDLLTESNLFREMTDSNIVSLPVEKILLENSGIYSASRANYVKTYGMFQIASRDGLACTDTVGMSSYRSYYKPGEFFEYNNRGKLRSRSDSDGRKTTFLWGYKGEELVAEIEGAVYNDIVQYVPPTLVGSLESTGSDQQVQMCLGLVRTLLAGSGYHITTYTHNPLVGITSQTLPNGQTFYYEYDDRKRLSAIKDKDGNTLKTFNYNYNTDYR